MARLVTRYVNIKPPVIHTYIDCEVDVVMQSVVSYRKWVKKFSYDLTVPQQKWGTYNQGATIYYITGEL